MGLLKQYVDAMKAGNLDRCIKIEQDNHLFGYPPEMVSVALKAIDDDRDPNKALFDYQYSLGVPK
jgi:hypothetical protein